jgi:hypothetical protein
MATAAGLPWGTKRHTVRLIQLLSLQAVSVSWAVGTVAGDSELVDCQLYCRRPKEMHMAKGEGRFVAHSVQQRCLRYEPCSEGDEAVPSLEAAWEEPVASHETCPDGKDIRVDGKAGSRSEADSTAVAERD